MLPAEEWIAQEIRMSGKFERGMKSITPKCLFVLSPSISRPSAFRVQL